MEDVVGLLLQYGRICASEGSRRPLDDDDGSSRSPRHTMDLTNGFDDEDEPLEVKVLPREVSETFASILRQSVLERRLY